MAEAGEVEREKKKRSRWGGPEQTKKNCVCVQIEKKTWCCLCFTKKREWLFF